LLKSVVPGGYFITGEAEAGIVKSIRGLRQLTPLAPIFVKQ